jgi:hypothetical protein
MHGCYVASDAANRLWMLMLAIFCHMDLSTWICITITWHSGGPIWDWEGRIRSQGACMLEALSGMEMEVPTVGFTMQQQDM